MTDGCTTYAISSYDSILWGADEGARVSRFLPLFANEIYLKNTLLSSLLDWWRYIRYNFVCKTKKVGRGREIEIYFRMYIISRLNWKGKLPYRWKSLQIEIKFQLWECQCDHRQDFWSSKNAGTMHCAFWTTIATSNNTNGITNTNTNIIQSYYKRKNWEKKDFL